MTRVRWTPRLPDGAALGRDLQMKTLETIMADTQLSPATKLVAWALHRHLNGQSGWAYPALDTIAVKVGMRRRDAMRHLEALEGGPRPGDRHAPKRSAPYVHSVKLGPQGHQSVYRCFLEPVWVTHSSGDTPQLDEERAAQSA